MKLIALSLVVLATSASAGTVYRDRPYPVPTGTPCFVPFMGGNINAGAIRDISVASRSWFKFEGFAGNVEQPPYMSLRVTFVTGSYFEEKTGDLKAQEAALLKAIKECR